MRNAPDPSAETTPAAPLSAVETHFAEMGMPTYAQAFAQIDYLTNCKPAEFSVLIADADDLKDTNDGEGGHLAGDKIIITTGEALFNQTNGKGSVTLGRHISDKDSEPAEDVSSEDNPQDSTTHHRKGDEFIIVLPDVRTQQNVDFWANKVQMELAKQGIHVTISGRPHQAGETASELLTGIDRLLRWDKGMRSVQEKTIVQVEAARKIGEIAAANGMSVREVAKMVDFLPFIPYVEIPKTNPSFSDPADPSAAPITHADIL